MRFPFHSLRVGSTSLRREHSIECGFIVPPAMSNYTVCRIFAMKMQLAPEEFNKVHKPQKQLKFLLCNKLILNIDMEQPPTPVCHGVTWHGLATSKRLT